jgi:hypothetical protein
MAGESLAEAQLPEAVGEVADRRVRTSDVPVRAEMIGSPVSPRPAAQVVLFRVAREGREGLSPGLSVMGLVRL